LVRLHKTQEIIMKQPLVTVALVYAAGIVLGYFLEPLLFPSLGVAFVAAVTAWVGRPSTKAR
jgi:hypothetical protein